MNYPNLPTSSSSSQPQQNGVSKTSFRVAVVVAILAVAMAVIAIMSNSDPESTLASNETSTTTSVTTVTKKATPTPSATKTSSKCIEADTTDVHVEMKALDKGIQTTEAGDPLIREAIEANKIQFISYLTPFAFQHEYDSKAPPKWKDFTVQKDGKTCLNDEGVKLRNKLLDRMSAQRDAKVDEGVSIPVDNYNTGMAEDGTPVINTHAGVPQGRKGTQYTFKDGTSFYVDWYCANATKAGKPHGFTPKFIPVPPQPPRPPVVCVGEHCNPQPPCIGPHCFPCIGDHCGPPPCPEPCEPEPPVVCPPGMHGQPPACKDDHTNGPGQVVDEPQRPNPLPARPDLEEEDGPDTPKTTAPYTPPAPVPVTPVPTDQGGPTAIPTPRETPAPEANAPTEEEPAEQCIPAPGMETC